MWKTDAYYFFLHTTETMRQIVVKTSANGFDEAYEWENE